MMNSASIHELVKSTLCEWGMPASLEVWRTLVIESGGFIGHRYHFDGGYAMWAEGSNTVQFYDNTGKPLRAIAVKSESRRPFDAGLWQEAYTAARIAELALASKSKQSG